MSVEQQVVKAQRQVRQAQVKVDKAEARLKKVSRGTATGLSQFRAIVRQFGKTRR